jgi:hypothetical protein
MFVTSNESVLEPFGTNQGDGQIDEQENADGCSNVNHRGASLNIFTSDQERVAKQHRSDAQQKREGYPDCEIHCSISPEAASVCTVAGGLSCAGNQQQECQRETSAISL